MTYGHGVCRDNGLVDPVGVAIVPVLASRLGSLNLENWLTGNEY